MTEVVAALIWKEGRFLICRRPPHKARGLLWEFAGGKLEQGETKRQALIRECREELGVTLSVGEPFMELIHQYPDISIRLTLFNASIAEGEPQPLEHIDLKWISPAEIPGYSFCPADKEILRRLIEQYKNSAGAKDKKEELTMLQAGEKAPDFTLPDKDGEMVSLSDFLGKKVILYFYPRDNTPGCTRQAQAFAKNNDAFERQNAVVIGISRDSQASHLKFAEKYGLPFLLLSDPGLEAIEAYGVWQEKKNYGKVSMGIVRSSFVIDEKGIIQKVIPKARPDTNAAELLAFIGGEG